MKALVFGRARGVWNEMVEARRLAIFDHVIAIGRAAVDYPGFIDHWVTFHAELFNSWSDIRRKHHFPMTSIMYWSAVAGRRRSHLANGFSINEIECAGGSSGLIGVKVALHLKCDKIVLAGIPMSPEFGHYDDSIEWMEAKEHRKAWERDMNELKDCVRSMSGWTAMLLGQPTHQWLNDRDTSTGSHPRLAVPAPFV